MMGEAPMKENIGQPEEEARIETHCYLCQQELPEGPAIISSKCGVSFHDDCAKRVVSCPACGENMLEHFLNEDANKKIVARDRIFTILVFVIPFVLIELLIGIWSMIDHPGKWSIPPWFGEAFIIDMVILILGILIALGIFFWFGYKPEKKAINAIVLAQKGAIPERPEEQLYACGYGDRARPLLFGDVSIPNKAGVQREGIVRVGVDRLTITPQGNYVWVNPRFLKLLPPKNNPQPSGPEELERIWKISGRTRMSEEDVEAGEEKLCSVCGKTLEYISEYEALYCSSCDRYEEEPPEEETPEEEIPPPEDELPPPEDETPPPS